MRRRLQKMLLRMARAVAPPSLSPQSPEERKRRVKVELATSVETSNRGTLCGVLLARDSAENIAEWLDFHRRSGLEHVYLYDNGLGNAALEVICDPHFTEFTTVIPFLTPRHPGRTRLEASSEPDLSRTAPTVTFQQLAYWHAITNYGSRWRWMTFIDSDEFLFPVLSDDLRVALEDYSDLPGLVTFWSMFGFSGHETPPLGGVVANFTRRSVFPVFAKTKVIVDPRNVSTIWNQHLIGDRLFDEQRRPVTHSDLVQTRSNGRPAGTYIPTHDVFRLNHYYTRSRSEFRAKHQKLVQSGHAAGAKKLLERAEQIEQDTVEDRSAIRFLPARDTE